MAALADEVRVDVKVTVGDDAEVGVPASVEVEGVAVTTYEPRVAARPRGVADAGGFACVAVGVAGLGAVVGAVLFRLKQ